MLESANIISRVSRFIRNKAWRARRFCQNIVKVVNSVRNIPAHSRRRRIRRNLDALLQEEEPSNETGRLRHSADVLSFLQRSDIDTCQLVSRQLYKAICRNSSTLPVYALDKLQLVYLRKVS